MKYGQRWNHIGIPALYTSQTMDLSRNEVFHGPAGKKVPSDYIIMHIDIPDSLEVLYVTPEDLKNEGIDWKAKDHQPPTQDFGSKLLLKFKFPVIALPSVVDESQYNFIINPGHPDSSQIKVVEHSPFTEK